MEPIRELPRLAPRDADSHKGTYGRVLILAGSREMPGAAVLCARSALRSGAGLVTVAASPAVGAIVGASVPEVTQLHLPELDDAHFADRAEAILRGRLEAGVEALVIGPGLGVAEGSRWLVPWTLRRAEVPRVIDADALNVLAASGDLSVSRPELCVWTPHPGELLRLTREKPRGDSKRLHAAARLAERVGGTVVLKGHRTVVAGGGGTYVNTTGNPGMATGGAGDVLSGVIAALLAQGLPPLDAAVLGVHVHGLAGDLAAAELGEIGLIAGDITERLPHAFRRVQSSHR